MFKLASDPQFTHTVPVLVPTDGGHREESIRARFRALGLDRIEELLKDNKKGVSAVLQAAIVALEDLVDEANQPVPYSDAVRDQLLNTPYARDALFRAYTAALAKARSGN